MALVLHLIPTGRTARLEWRTGGHRWTVDDEVVFRPCDSGREVKPPLAVVTSVAISVAGTDRHRACGGCRLVGIGRPRCAGTP